MAGSFDKTLLLKLLGEKGEDSIRHRAANLLEAMGIEDIVLEVTADRGEAADIVSHSHRLVVETKSRKSASPDKPGAKSSENQKDQIQRYLKYFANEMEQRHLLKKDPDSALEWRGLLTDGESWAYEWDAKAKAVVERSPAYHLAKRSSAGALSTWIQGHLTLHPGRLSLPGDLYNGLVEPFVQELVEIQEKAQGSDSYETKWELWKRILRSSGLLPDEKKTLQTMGLFRRHTALVALSRAVVAALEERPKLPAATELLGAGFVSWVIELDDGVKWTSKLIQESARYDWRGLERDALRVVYERLISPDIRHGFGEYYTPDWLAEAVCEEVLDEEWIERAVSSARKAAASPGGTGITGVGVLDPACGSGTFLFHAARRLLSARALRGLSLQEKASLVAHLVHGIDIHPVAVEMSRATLAAALPVLPKGGPNALLVHQGDSMTVRNRQDPLFTFGVDGALSIQTPQGRDVTFPVEILNHGAFVKIVEDLIQEAVTNSAVPPLGERAVRSFVDSREWGSDFDAKTKRTLGQTLVSLHTVCDKEGNHVWEWYIRNLAAPLKLERAKVDRIVANPPWVRFSAAGMSLERQRQLREIADEHGVWTGGQTATRMDLAAVFVPETRRRFLVPGVEDDAGGRSGWVLPAGVLLASQWEGFRNAVRGWGAAWDFSKVQEPPFTGSSSCVLLSGSSPNAKFPRARAWENRRGEKIGRSEPWRDVRTKLVQVRPPRTFPRRPSDYEGNFRQGATLTPSPLIVAGESRAIPGMPGVAEITCRQGSQTPWNAVPPLRGRVERKSLLPALFGGNLLPLRVDGYREIVVPVDRKGKVDPESLPAHLGKFWNRAEQIWGENRKERSPESLLGRIDYQHKLSRQLPLDDSRSKRRVIYNTSGGDFLRAARLRDGKDRCMSNRVYHWVAASENEALFLVALLNTDSLQAAYQAAKKSGRDFHTHFWSVVPIPKYDAKHAAHQELAKAAREAERVAAKVDLGPSGAEKRIRSALRESGVMQRMDRAAREILPDHAS